jgi:hypothetical protein
VNLTSDCVIHAVCRVGNAVADTDGHCVLFHFLWFFLCPFMDLLWFDEVMGILPRLINK